MKQQVIDLQPGQYFEHEGVLYQRIAWREHLGVSSFLAIRVSDGTRHFNGQRQERARLTMVRVVNVTIQRD